MFTKPHFAAFYYERRFIMATFTHNTKKVIVELGTSGKNVKRLTLTSWNDNPAKLDLRTWVKDGKKLTPGKGITLSNDEAVTLARALAAYLAQNEVQEG